MTAGTITEDWSDPAGFRAGCVMPLAQYFLGPGAEPATTLLGGIDRDPRVSPAPKRRIDATLLVSRDDTVLRRVAERVQLDLLRAGVTAIIQKVPPRTLAARRKDQRFDLMVDTFFPDGPPGDLAADRFHALLSIAAASGSIASSLTADEISSFVRAPEEQRRSLLVALERAVRIRAGIIPIAVRTPMIAVRTDLVHYTVTPFGRIDFADAFFAHPEAEHIE